MAGQHSRALDSINVREIVKEAAEEIAAEDAGTKAQPRISTPRDPMAAFRGGVLKPATKPATPAAKKK